MGEIIWNGVSSRSIPIVIENPPSYMSPERDYDAVHVLGRNGDLLTENNSFKNVECSYDIAFGSYEKVHSEMASAVSEWLRSASGYARLEDTYDIDHFRMAYYQEETDLENVLNHLGRATITFNCMPQRFLKSGETPVIFTETGSILLNPTSFIALPLITVYGGTGAATLTVNDLTITIKSIGNQMTFDSELGEVYMKTTDIPVSKNDQIEWPETIHHAFPSLQKGQNKISFTGHVTRVEVIPRWWVT